MGRAPTFLTRVYGLELDQGSLLYIFISVNSRLVTNITCYLRVIQCQSFPP